MFQFQVPVPFFEESDFCCVYSHFIFVKFRLKLSLGKPLPPPEVLMLEIIALVSSYFKKLMNLPFSTRPTCKVTVPIFEPWLHALYISVVDRSDIFEKFISENIGRPAVRSVLDGSLCMGIDAPCEKLPTMILSA